MQGRNSGQALRRQILIHSGAMPAGYCALRFTYAPVGAITDRYEAHHARQCALNRTVTARLAAIVQGHNTMEATFDRQPDKEQALSRTKWIATSLFVLVTVIYLLSRVLERRYPELAMAAAFAEAAMVGALADWFAVVALFRHPMGLPIPHTAIIPRNKGRLAENLGTFIATNFLGTATILARIRTFDPAARLAAWLV